MAEHSPYTLRQGGVTPVHRTARPLTCPYWKREKRKLLINVGFDDSFFPNFFYLPYETPYILARGVPLYWGGGVCSELHRMRLRARFPTRWMMQDPPIPPTLRVWVHRHPVVKPRRER